MKQILKLTVMAFALAVHTTVSAQDYKLVWSDEFNENTLGANWNVIQNEAPYNNELQAYAKQNVTIENGNLVLTARREEKGAKQFTSGRIDSHTKVSFTHGRLEARIKMPHLANGLWPAFWLMGEELGEAAWPKCGEIDIMEAGNSEAIKNSKLESTVAGAIHYGESIGTHKQYTAGNYTAKYDVTGDYHTFTMEWDDENLRFFLDDEKEPYFEKAVKKGFSIGNYFHHPYYIIFNLAVGGDYTGITSPDAITALPNMGDEAKMYVDYIRLYQKVGSEDFTTSIARPTINSTMSTPCHKKGCYNLLGEAVNPDAMHHGIYIIDGEKHIVR